MNPLTHGTITILLFHALTAVQKVNKEVFANKDGNKSVSADKPPTFRTSCNDVIKLSNHEEEDDNVEETPSTEVEMIEANTFCPNTSRVPSSNKSKDACLFSDDEIRISTLKSSGKANRVNDNQDQLQPKKKKQRKSKISFEISPLLIMADMLDERELESETNLEGEGVCLVEQTLAKMLQLKSKDV